MIITEDFVVLNLPKTGSTFVRTMLKTIYRRRMERRPMVKKGMHFLRIERKPLFKELLLPNNRRKLQQTAADQHGTYEQIPLAYRNRPVVSVLRNPYDRLLSLYDFRDWRKRPPLPPNLLREHFPRFPDLTFDDFCRLEELALASELPHMTSRADVGKQTVRFIQMFFKHPDDVLGRLDEEYVASDRFVDDIADVVFLRTESLNHDLAEFLARHGFSSEEVAFVCRHEKVHVTKNRSPDRDRIWTESAVNFVRTKERFLFKILAHYGLIYSPPQVGRSSAATEDFDKAYTVEKGES